MTVGRVLAVAWRFSQHANLVFGPQARLRWYTENPIEVRVPLRLVLHADLALLPAAKEKMHGQKAKQMESALTKGAQVLSEEDHEIIMEELHARDMGDEDEWKWAHRREWGGSERAWRPGGVGEKGATERGGDVEILRSWSLPDCN